MRGYIVYIWIGVWLLILPFFGVPGSWKEALFVLTALFLIVYSYIGHRNASRAMIVKDDTGGALADNTATDERATF